MKSRKPVHSRRTWVFIAMAVVLVVALGSAVWTLSADDESGRLETELTDGTSTATVTPDESSDSLGARLRTWFEAMFTAGDVGSRTSNGEDPQSSPGASREVIGPGADDRADEPFTLRVMWWNDTVSRAPEGFRIELAGGFWEPSEHGSEHEVGRVEGVPAAGAVDLVVFPDGEEGARIVVPVQLDGAMVSDSEEDAIHIEVTDEQVRIVGTPLLDFDVVESRF